MCKNFVLVAVVVILALVSNATAATMFWTGLGADDDWDNALNWDDGTHGVPDSSTEVKMEDFSVNGPVISAGMTAEAYDLKGPAWGISEGTGTLDITGGSLTIGNDWKVQSDVVNQHAEVTISGGSVDVAKNIYVSKNGTGLLDISGGDVYFKYLNLGYGSGTGTVNIYGLADVVCKDLFPVSSAGALNLTGGTLTVDRDIYTSNGSIDITEGKLIAYGEITSLSNVTAYGGAGVLVFNYEADKAEYTTITAIPEPATIALLGLGMILIRRKRA